MKTVMLVICLLISVSAFSQDGDYIQLKPSEAEAAKSAYENYKKAEAELEKIKDKIAKNYIETKVSTTDKSISFTCSTCGPLGRGWQFSKDFKIIMPKNQITATSDSGILTWPCGGTILTAPAVTHSWSDRFESITPPAIN